MVVARSEAYEWLEDAQQLVIAVLHVASHTGDPAVIDSLVQQQAPVALFEVAKSKSKLSVRFRMAALRCCLLLYNHRQEGVTAQIDARFGVGCLTKLLLSMLEDPVMALRRHASALLAAFSSLPSTR